MIKQKQQYQVTDFQFEINNLSFEETGSGWKGILANITLLIDEESVIKNPFKRSYELTSTIKKFHKGIENLFRKGSDDGFYFMCNCGVDGDSGIHWHLILKKNNIIIKMENLVSEPIGKHFYEVNKLKFLEGILNLYNKVIGYMEENNLNQTDTGTLKEFKRMHQDIDILKR